jgi:tetratricopeptide (TPR) repeat protein
VSKAKPVSHSPAAADTPAAKAGLLSRLLGTGRRRIITLAGLLAAIIGSGGALALVFWPASKATYVQQQAQAFGELHKGNRAAARQMAAKLLLDTSVGYSDHGGAYYILGIITLHEADEQINRTKRQVLDLVAARYLDEAIIRGIPEPHRRTGLLALGRSLHDAGRFDRSSVILHEALDEIPEEASQIHALLADCYLRSQPPKLPEALEHNQSYLELGKLSDAELDAGSLLSARILLAQNDPNAAVKTIAPITEKSTLHTEAILLQGQILLAQLNSPNDQPEEGVTAIVVMQDQLRKLLARENLSPRLAVQALLLIGRLFEEQGDARGAVSQFDAVRRNFFGQPEAIAATVYEANLIRAEKPRESVEFYKRALSQLANNDEANDNLWLPSNELRMHVSSAIDYFAERGNFAEAVELAETLTAPVPPTVTVERQASIHRAWARQLEDKARKEKLPQAPVTEAEARQHWRQSGALWRKLAAMRLASRRHVDDLAKSAEDFRRGHGFEQAAAVYRELIIQEPQDGQPEALVGLGESLLALGKIPEALVVLGECRETYSRHPVTYRARLLSGLALAEQGKLLEAQELLTDNLYGYSLAPQSVDWRDSLFALGTILYRQATELEGKSRLVGVDRASPEGRREGFALLEQSHTAFEDALRTLTEAVERYPNAPQVLEARYRIAEAHRHAAKLPRKRLENVTIRTSISALNRQKQEQLLAASEGYKTLIAKLSEKESSQQLPIEAAILRNCYFGRADALFDMEQFEKAIEAYSAATNRYQHDPESLEAYVQIASCHRRLGRPNEARRTLDQARVVLQRIRPDADFVRTTRLARQEWGPLLEWLRTL